MGWLLTCISCGNEERRTSNVGRQLYCLECRGRHKREAVAAIAKVAAAIRSGALPKPSDLRCADCGGNAQQYDHRDYLRPLDVEPVCIACNYRRGPALDSRMRAIRA